MSVALLSSGSALAAHLPYFHLGAIETGVVPIQAFGILVALGVLIGASLLRRYAEWHGISDEDIRGLTAWVTVSGFIGAHIFDVLAYQWDNLATPGTLHYEGPILLLKVWSGISSYGGFIGGAGGFAFYVWWKRLPARLMADITIMGLLPAFSIGRIGCTVVSDHIGAMVDSTQWYAALAMDYPAKGPDTLGPIAELARDHHVTADHLLAWNLGLVELLWLIPVNALLLWLGFRAQPKRINAGFLVVMTGVLYAPVRFFLDFLRPENTDPRYAGLTFAQWSSFLAFGAAAVVAVRIFKTGAPAKTITATSGEAQARLKVILKESDDEDKDEAKGAAGEVSVKKAKRPEAKASVAAAKADAKDKVEEAEDEADDEVDAAKAKADAAKAKASAAKGPAKPVAKAKADDAKGEADEAKIDAKAKVDEVKAEAKAEVADAKDAAERGSPGVAPTLGPDD